jgi:hypothetical protein
MGRDDDVYVSPMISKQLRFGRGRHGFVRARRQINGLMVVMGAHDRYRYA